MPYPDASANLLRYFVNGPTYIDERVAVYDAFRDKEYYYLLRELYTVAGLADEDGGLFEIYDYDAYGKVRVYHALGRAPGQDVGGVCDLDDFRAFQVCFDPDGPVATGCEWADYDTDDTVGLGDFEILGQKGDITDS